MARKRQKKSSNFKVILLSLIILSLVLGVSQLMYYSISNFLKQPENIAKASFESSTSSSSLYFRPSLIAFTLPLNEVENISSSIAVSSSSSIQSNLFSSSSSFNNSSQVSKISSSSSFPVTGKNLLVYEKYKIQAPLIYSSNTDFFNTFVDGSVDFSSPREATTINSPVQLLLRQGIVHVAYTPLPGQYGNCYILGHSSNYTGVASMYNDIFEPIKAKSQIGEEFYVFDSNGVRLNYRVFETKAISLNDTLEAMKDFPGKKVITLQTSYNGGAWITRGELF